MQTPQGEFITAGERGDFDVNLLEQVLDVLIAHGRNANDILFITEGKGEYMLYDDFNRKSDFTYSFLDGMVEGNTVLNPDLQLVGKDFYIDFEQGEFTLAMCWHEIPKMPEVRNRKIPLTVDFSYE